MCRFLLQDGLSVEILQSLSFRTNLGLSLKNSLAHFTKAALLHEIEEISVWYDETAISRTDRRQKFSMICWVFALCATIMMKF